MKNKKRILSLILMVVLVIGLVACGNKDKAENQSSKSSKSSTEKAKSYDKVVFAYATFNNIPAAEDLDKVEEAINVLTRERIGVEVTLMPISIADYSSKVRLALQGGEQIDIFESFGDFNNSVSSDMTYDITNLIKEYAPETEALVGKQWLDACVQDGKLYGIPTYKPVALTPMVLYRKDIATKLGIDMSKVNSLEDVTAVFEKVKETYPDMIPLAPVQTGEIGLATNWGDVDFLTDDMYTPIGVLIGKDMTVKDLYSSDLFMNRCKLVRSWFEKGLVMKDAATTTSVAAELMASGNYFSYIAAYSYPEADTAAALSAQCGGYELGAKMIGSAYLSTSDLNAVSWMIASTTKVPEAAMKFLNLTYTDEEVINLIIYGLEGRDYVKNDDGTVSYPAGEDATTVPYTAQLTCGIFGNFFLQYPMAGTDPASLSWELEQNRVAKTSPAMGFTFDSSKLKTQYAAVKIVLTKYLPGLSCGTLDPEKEIPNFIEALNSAGYQDILKAKQEQLDAWAAKQ